ncbi:MAG: tRNA preQ1(34) S-adenosylmethionine ribosyltransferase-isomerase QueA [Endomicrobiaceae bacterium]|nr:tRNA preQ1(34) S-adenosylmethionine ribosyltransferase-isomerase QueA [Endomicrobiaceae bacterium]
MQNSNENKDNLLSNYNYEIPEELIAQKPLENRSSSNLIVLNRKDKTISHHKFYEIADMLNENDCLVINTTKVVPARLYGKKATGGKVEILFLNPTADKDNKYTVLMKPYVKTGQTVYFDGGYECKVLEGLPNGNKIISFNKGNIDELLDKYGFMPLPPYIKRKDGLAQKMAELDRQRYQTVYANNKGAIAAPTAGLHFTEDILSKLKQKGVEIINIVLHVGWGTFKPILAQNINEHKMLPERYIVSEESAAKLNNALQQNKRIIAVGTTSVRTLETVAAKTGTFENNKLVSIKACSGQTDIFIYPGYKFKLIKSMITNLHLPQSTPLMMTSAFAGREFVLSAYKEAIDKKYRFFSYGDSMFIQ